MRKASGIAFISLGAIGLAICGIVLLRLPLPIPWALLQHFGIFGFHIRPVQASMSSLVFLMIGVSLLRRPKAVPTKGV